MEKYVRTTILTLLALVVSALTLVQPAIAQLEDDDPFGENDNAPPPAAKNTIIDPSQTALFGTGVYTGPPPAMPTDNWGNLNNLPSDERIEDTYEMKIREENSKPLPERNPFGDRMKDLLKTKKDTNKKPLF